MRIDPANRVDRVVAARRRRRDGRACCVGSEHSRVAEQIDQEVQRLTAPPGRPYSNLQFLSVVDPCQASPDSRA